MTENEHLKEELLKRLEKAYQEQEKVARGLAEERLKIDSKLSVKEHEIKEWALKQVEENYSDYNRLLNAKIIESENKIKQAMAGLKARNDPAIS